jgi:G3E family GTPase
MMDANTDANTITEAPAVPMPVPIPDLPATDQPATDDGRIPVTLLTGFLGAGKTTLLNHLVQQQEFAGTAVLINEFGAIGIDHHLVQHVGETLVLLESGCICCAVRGDLVAALKDLHEKLSRRQISAVRRVVIETTGLADPVPVVWTLMEERFISTRFRCDGVVSVVDASLGAAQLDAHQEARRQVALADRIVISKPDLADRSAREALEARLAALNPSAPRMTVSHGTLAPDWVTGAGIYAAAERTSRFAAWLGTEEAPAARHDDSLATFTLHFDRPVPWRGFCVALGGLLNDHGDHILRLKGLMNVAGAEGPVVVQAVGRVAYPVVRLPRWPGHTGRFDRGRFDMRGRLVFITQHLSQDQEADIRQRLAFLPDDAAALRAAATTPLLPTRCWLGARMPVVGRGGFETDGWRIQPLRLGAGSAIPA